MNSREREVDNPPPEGDHAGGVREIAAASLRILRKRGAWTLLRQMGEKVRRREFWLMEQAYPPELRLREEKSQKRQSSANDASYRDLYQKMLSETTYRKNLETSLPEEPTTHQPPVKLIAFYLPQFHPIPENDVWWGRGFTEWTNVSKALPQFVGHYQPRLPGELGFYDLRLVDVQKAQIELARQYGIYGFCFYYYWFNGKRLLERPLDQLLANPELDFPFCLCWANENWTRRWDGLTKDVLIGQNYSPEWDLRFIKSIEGALRDKRYIRIHGKPLLIVYNAGNLPSPRKVTSRWREYCRQHGMGELYLAATQTFHVSDPRPLGFDAAIELPPHQAAVREITEQVELLNSEFAGQVFDYRNLVERRISRKKNPSFERFLGVMTGWDNDPRRPGRGVIYAHSTPIAYAKWLEDVCRRTLMQTDGEKRLVFINAWNEWAEGAYLEPDRKYGRAYLKATKSVLDSIASSMSSDGNGPNGDFLDRRTEKRSNTAIILHVYYPELVKEILRYLRNLKDDCDLFVSIPTTVDFSEDEIRKRHSNVYFYRCENRGRDIAPFLRIFSHLYPLRYDYICKIHSKKSRHRQDGEYWRREIYSKLMGSPKIVEEIKAALQKPNIGIVAPQGHVIDSEYYWGVGKNAKANRANVQRLADDVGLDVEKLRFPFVSGSMFWFKPTVLHLLIKLTIRTSDFEPERGETDGTLAHAVERFIGLVAQQAGYEIAEIDDEGRTTISRSEGAAVTPWAIPSLNGKALVFGKPTRKSA